MKVDANALSSAKLLLCAVVLPLWLSSCPGFMDERPVYSLSTFVRGAGEVVRDIEGFAPEGTTVELTGLAETGWDFDHWSGDADTSANPLRLYMDRDKRVTAFFVDPSYVGGNNREVFFAADFSIGEGTAPTSWITATIPVECPSHAQLSVGPAYVMRGVVINDFSSSILVPITNRSDSIPAPFAKAVNVAVKDTSNQVVHTASSAYVYGSVGNLSGTEIMASLAPQETGYLFLILFEDWQDIASIEFQLECSYYAVANTTAEIRPVGLEMTNVNAVEGMIVSFQNSGNGPGIVDDGGHVYIIRDLEGVPLDIGFLSDEISPADGRLDVAGVGTATEAAIYLDGAGRYVEVLLDFEDEAPVLYRYSSLETQFSVEAQRRNSELIAIRAAYVDGLRQALSQERE